MNWFAVLITSRFGRLSIDEEIIREIAREIVSKSARISLKIFRPIILDDELNRDTLHGRRRRKISSVQRNLSEHLSDSSNKNNSSKATNFSLLANELAPVLSPLTLSLSLSLSLWDPIERKSGEQSAADEARAVDRSFGITEDKVALLKLATHPPPPPRRGNDFPGDEGKKETGPLRTARGFGRGA